MQIGFSNEFLYFFIHHTKSNNISHFVYTNQTCHSLKSIIDVEASIKRTVGRWVPAELQKSELHKETSDPFRKVSLVLQLRTYIHSLFSEVIIKRNVDNLTFRKENRFIQIYLGILFYGNDLSVPNHKLVNFCNQFWLQICRRMDLYNLNCLKNYIHSTLWHHLKFITRNSLQCSL